MSYVHTLLMETTSLFRTCYIKVLTAVFLAAATVAALTYAYAAYTEAQNWAGGPMIITVSG